jgi:hypothetical protein
VNQKLAFLVLRDFPPSCSRFGLRIVNRRGAAIAFAADRPTLLVRHNVLILGHIISPICLKKRDVRLYERKKPFVKEAIS